MAVEWAVVNSTTPSSTTTKSFTSSGFGTPTAAIVLLGNNGAFGNPYSGAVSTCIGAMDGTREGCCSIFVNDAQSTTDTARSHSASRCLMLGGSASSQYASFSAWTTDGVTLSFTWSFSARNITVILLKGTTNVRMDRYTLTGTSANDITTYGFKPDVLINFTVGDTTTQALDTTHGIISVGVVHNNSSDTVTQAAIGFSSPDGETVASKPSCTVRNDVGIMQQFNESVSWQGVYSAFDANGFSVTPNVNPGGDYVYTLAIELDDPDDADITVYTSPTATGNWAKTDPGFQPSFLFAILGAVATINTIETDQDGGIFGLSVTDGTNSGYHGHTEEDAVGTSNTESNHDTNVCDLRTYSGGFSALYTATLSSFDASGFTWNFSAENDSASRVWPILAFKDTTAGGGTTALYYYMNNQ